RGERSSGLADEKAERELLPTVRIDEVPDAVRSGRVEGRVHRSVEAREVVVGFVRPVAEPETDHAIADIVAERRRRRIPPIVDRRVARVEPVVPHYAVEHGKRSALFARIAEAVRS